MLASRAAERKLILGSNTLRSCGRDSDLISPASQGGLGGDAIMIKGGGPNYIYVRNLCLEGAEEVFALPRRGSRYSGRVESVRP